MSAQACPGRYCCRKSSWIALDNPRIWTIWTAKASEDGYMMVKSPSGRTFVGRVRISGLSAKTNSISKPRPLIVYHTISANKYV